MLFWRDSCSILVRKHFKNDPDVSEVKKKSKFNVSHIEFLIFREVLELED